MPLGERPQGRGGQAHRPLGDLAFPPAASLPPPQAPSSTKAAKKLE